MAGLLFWKKKCLVVRFDGVQRGFLSERKGKVIPSNRDIYSPLAGNDSSLNALASRAKK